jgi:hypothetical protein
VFDFIQAPPEHRRQVIDFVAVYRPGAQQLGDDFKGCHLLHARDGHKEGAFVAARGGLRLNRWIEDIYMMGFTIEPNNPQRRAADDTGDTVSTMLADGPAEKSPGLRAGTGDGRMDTRVQGSLIFAIPEHLSLGEEPVRRAQHNIYSKR